MRLRSVGLRGLAIGAALLLVPPDIAALTRSIVPAAQAAAPEPSARPEGATVLPSPAPLPRVMYPDLSPQAAGAHPPLPAVITPSAPRRTGKAGTGFFIARDGSLLTAAHVVTDCGRTSVVSRYVKPTAAHLLATDRDRDIALLRAPDLRPPAVLTLGGPTSRRMFVLGYPEAAGPIVPAETWATLENDKLPLPVGTLTDPRETIWIEAAAVTHGYSGGPILDPGTGAVVGIVRGMVDMRRLPFVRGMPMSGVTIGPGAGQLTAFLRRELPTLATAEPSDTGDAALDDARRATVHVICWP